MAGAWAIGLGRALRQMPQEEGAKLLNQRLRQETQQEQQLQPELLKGTQLQNQIRALELQEAQRQQRISSNPDAYKALQTSYDAAVDPREKAYIKSWMDTVKVTGDLPTALEEIRKFKFLDPFQKELSEQKVAIEQQKVDAQKQLNDLTRQVNELVSGLLKNMGGGIGGAGGGGTPSGLYMPSWAAEARMGSSGPEYRAGDSWYKADGSSVK